MIPRRALGLTVLSLHGLLASFGAGHRYIDLSGTFPNQPGTLIHLHVINTESLEVKDLRRLIIHFHGSSKVARQMLDDQKPNTALLSVHLAGLSGSYRSFFSSSRLFQTLVDTAVSTLRATGFHVPAHFELVLTSFSAGYGAIREILKDSVLFRRIGRIVLADGLHASLHDSLMQDQMKDFVRFAELAAEGRKVLLISHSSIKTDGYRSTTETSDFILEKLALAKHPDSSTDTIGRRLYLSHKRNLSITGYAGDSAPDHMKHFFGMQGLVEEALRMGIDAALPGEIR